MLFEFLRGPKSKVVDLAEKQIRLTIGIVEKLREAMIAFSEGNSSKYEECIKKIFFDETKIDDLRRLVFEELSKGDFQPKYHSTIMDLVTRIDILADHVKDAARSLKILPNKIPKEIMDINIRITETLVDCSILLGTAMEMLGINAPQAREITNRIEEYENIIDKEYLAAKVLFLKYSEELDFAILLLLSDLLESLEKTADMCADTADYIRVLAVS